MTRGVFKRRNSPAPDPYLKIVNTDHDKRKTAHYRKILNTLVFLIYEHITPFINWNHTAIPSICKTKLPLRFEGEHMDISFILPDGTLAFLQLHVLDPERVAKKYKVIKWQSDK